jgi:hypothetical protein
MIRGLLIGSLITWCVGILGAKFEAAPRHPKNWIHVSDEVTKSHIELTFALKLRNTDELTDILLSVSTPSSPNYGKLYTLEEVEALTNPSKEAIEKVVQFLAQHNIHKYDIVSGFIRTIVTVQTAEQMLSTNYSTYKHATIGVSTIRCTGYSLPDDVAQHIAFVAPTVNFPQQKTKTVSYSSKVFFDQNTPYSLRELYGVGDAFGGLSNTKQGKYYNITNIT